MAPGVRVAAVDCGTNSIRLLVVEYRAGEAPRELARRTTVIRLGEGVDATRRLAPAALERARARCEEYADECARLDVGQVRFAATSATRDVRNAEAFTAVVERAFARWRTTPEVLSGADEARLTFLGAARALGAAGQRGPIVVVDLGGGSTELVRGGTGLVRGEAEVEAACSIDIGAVRLHERIRPQDPPTPDDVAAIEAQVTAALDVALAEVPLAGARAVVGVAGTSTTVAAYELGLAAYDAARVHLSRSTPLATAAAARRLAALPLAQRAQVPGVVAGRVDVIGAGALEWALVLERAAGAGVPEVVVSEADLLDGLVAELAARPVHRSARPARRRSAPPAGPGGQAPGRSG